MSEWFIYILECNDGSFYTGVTNNIEKRMDKHKKGTGSKYVKKRGFKQLLYSNLCGTKSNACKCEYAVKQLSKYEKINWFKKLKN
ncbi:GIY-YIG catalytic domain protein [Candidatus Tiddalikarchaeum anstoanum]|nr:GIY-YIG catalytic domain protein [Candidatus Tiddalikarchaeum anstoanum]